MIIGDTKIGKDSPPFIIAEMSGNHNQSLEKALKIVDEAALSGASAIKIQTYTADTMTLNLEGQKFSVESDSKSPWAGRDLYNLYKEAHTPWEWHAAIFQRAKERGILAFSTPFDNSSVEFLESLNVPCYKIASFENIDIPLIRRIVDTGKPVFLSTGMATLGELDEAVTELKRLGDGNFALLKCTSSYPANPKNSNIATIAHIRELFKCEAGISDHTLGIGVSVASIAFGASIIEKHFVTNRLEGGVDSQFSLEPDEFKLLTEESYRAWQSIGNISYGPTDSELELLKFRRSIYASSDIKKGEKFTTTNLKVIRPGHGLPPKYLDKIIGKTSNKDILRGSPLDWDIIGQ